MDRDRDYMRRAFALAIRAGAVRGPNPQVGALVTLGDRVIGEGFHRGAGSAHAEVMALIEAGSAAKGATLYSTLEPCCHEEKRTPPCVPQIIEEGIRRVVIASLDPNPLVRGRGKAQLERAGIRVDIVAGQTRRFALLNEAYVRSIQAEVPFVHLKWAQTADGQIATADGDSRWIGNKTARRCVHRLRSMHDAVMVGRAPLGAIIPV